MGEREISFLPHVWVIWTRIISVYHFWGPQHLGQYRLSLNRIPSCSLSYYFGTFEALLLLLSHIEYPIDYEQSLLFGEVRPAARKYQFFFHWFLSLARRILLKRRDFSKSKWLMILAQADHYHPVWKFSQWNITLQHSSTNEIRLKKNEKKRKQRGGQEWVAHL